MDRQSKSASIPLTSQHLGADPQPDFGWEETFKKLDSLGRGGCAEVFRALDKRSGELVALKVSNESGEELRRFRREVATLRELRHQNVIEILDAGDCWYTMPLADGNLTKLAPELCDEERIEAVAQAAQGLAAVHIAGRVHRDVSPNNILRIGKRWVVSDFGFVRKPQGTSSEPKTRGAMGTPGYMAPEVLALGSHSATHHSDMYSLGQTVAFITTGKHPVSRERPQVPRIWESLVAKMTAVAVNERFQSMDELVEALLDVQRQLKKQRRAEWSAGHNAVEGLSQAEVNVMAMIIQETNNVFREHEILNGMPKRERGTFNIGLIGLQRRHFLEDNVDEEGRLWGYRLTDAARDWLVANPDFLNAFPPSEPESPQDDAQDDDGIPF
ncbi:serine/threonine protein kinase [Cystobacter fuscus]|uniref:serine/threonine protein kinase n=1 Tax=Cystobacter fuscus TaxID=43 RepID=UPI0012DE4E1A|nr:serine/threonine-protein kinase [Cystobacter fuscus]